MSDVTRDADMFEINLNKIKGKTSIGGQVVSEFAYHA
jgi:hypothetical protein